MTLSLLNRSLKVAKVAYRANKLRNARTESGKQVARRALASQFADARGSLMKVGQLLSAGQDDSFDSLVKGISAIPLEQIQPFIERSLEKSLGTVFHSIQESKNAASLGQVHEARLINGQQVAVKVRYPDIVEQVQAEIKIFGLLPGIGPVKKWGMDIESYKRAFKSNMDRELDYRQESETQRLFKKGLKLDGLCIPEVYADFTKPDLLVQSWEPGQYIDEISDWPLADRKRFGEILLGSLFKSLFELGVVHGDPHKGNFYFRRDSKNQPEVVLMDFGCRIEVEENKRLALLNLILAVSENQPVVPVRNFVAMGFDADKLIKIGDSLPMLSLFLFKPFIQKGVFHLSHWELEDSVERLLGDKRWWFRSAGPADLFLLMRAFQGIVQHLEMLSVSISWMGVLRNCLDANTLDSARNLQLPPIPQEQQASVSDVSVLAKRLCVRVLVDGKEKVKVSLPAELALNLADLMPDEVLKRLMEDESFDFKAVQQKLIASGLVPQNVFEFVDGSKRYRVWLE